MAWTRWPLTNVPLELFRSAMRVIAVAAAEFGVMARDLGVVNLDGVRGVAPQAENGVLQLEAAALIVSANDEQRCHAPRPPGKFKRSPSPLGCTL